MASEPQKIFKTVYIKLTVASMHVGGITNLCEITVFTDLQAGPVSTLLSTLYYVWGVKTKQCRCSHGKYENAELSGPCKHFLEHRPTSWPDSSNVFLHPVPSLTIPASS
jgi:hypothetical protein